MNEKEEVQLNIKICQTWGKTSIVFSVMDQEKDTTQKEKIKMHEQNIVKILYSNKN